LSHGPPPSPPCLPAIEESVLQIKALGYVGISVCSISLQGLKFHNELPPPIATV
jgi:hypothetical protein